MKMYKKLCVLILIVSLLSSLNALFSCASNAATAEANLRYIFKVDRAPRISFDLSKEDLGIIITENGGVKSVNIETYTNGQWVSINDKCTISKDNTSVIVKKSVFTDGVAMKFRITAYDKITTPNKFQGLYSIKKYANKTNNAYYTGNNVPSISGTRLNSTDGYYNTETEMLENFICIFKDNNCIESIQIKDRNNNNAVIFEKKYKEENSKQINYTMKEILAKAKKDSNGIYKVQFLVSDKTGMKHLETMNFGKYTKTNVKNLEGFLFIGDSITCGLRDRAGLDTSKYTFKCEGGMGPKYWLDNFSTFPANSNKIKGVNIFLGTNWQDKQLNEMKELVKKVATKYPNKPIFVNKIFTTIVGKYSEGANNFNIQMKSFCEKDMKNYNIFYIDATSGIALADGTHPASYTKLYSNLQTQITTTRIKK